MSDEPHTPEQPARRAAWMDGDVPATVAYLRKQAAELGDTAIDQRNTYRVVAIAMIATIQFDPTKSARVKTRLTVSALDALEQALAGEQS